jgi:hypothetical protein
MVGKELGQVVGEQLVELFRLQFLSESVLSKFGERHSAGTVPLCYRDSDANANELVQNQI